MEIEKRISRLLSHIAKTNNLKEASGKKSGEYITVDGTPHMITFISGAGKVKSNEISYFLVDVDWDELLQICVEVSKTNPLTVAPEDVRRYLIELIWEMKKNDWSKRGIKQKIIETIHFIKHYTGEKAVVTVPVWGLRVGGKSLAIGDVEFKPRPFPEDVEKSIEQLDPEEHGINTIAITSSAGDRATIFGNAKVKINEALNILRAFSFPIANNNQYQEISIEGDFSHLQNLGFLNYQSYSAGLRDITSHGFYSFGIGWGLPFIIGKNRELMNLLGFDELLKIINNTDKFSKRIVKAVGWLGEATKPDVLPAKFVKLAFSIDAMIGAEEKNIPDQGKRARIAERAAFLLEHRYKERKRVFDKMSEIIKRRDEIAHGGSKIVITEIDVEEAGQYARALLKELLFRNPKFKDIRQLAEWVRKQSLIG